MKDFDEMEARGRASSEEEAFRPIADPFSGCEGRLLPSRLQHIRKILDMVRRGDGSMNYGHGAVLYGRCEEEKTDILSELTEQFREQFGDDILIWDVRSCIPGEDGTLLPNLIYSLLSSGRRGMRKNRILRPLLESQGLLNVPLDAVLEQPAFAASLFQDYMNELNDLLREENKLIVLIVANFTAQLNDSPSGEGTREFMRFWKVLIQNNCMFTILTGDETMPRYLRQYVNELAALAAIELDDIASEEAEQLVRWALEQEEGQGVPCAGDGCVEKICRLTAGSPDLLRKFCSELIRYLNENRISAVSRNVVQSFLNSRVLIPGSFMEAVFDDLLRTDNPDGSAQELERMEREILYLVAQFSQCSEGSALLADISCKGHSAEEVRDCIDLLTERKLLAREPGGRIRIRVKLLERWLCATSPTQVQPPLHRNIFQYGSVVTGESFLGRRSEVDEISSLLFQGCASRSVVGPTRIGKTSIVTEALERNRNYPRHLSIFITMSNYQTAFDFWKALMDRFIAQVKQAGLWDEELEGDFAKYDTRFRPENTFWWAFLQTRLDNLTAAINSAEYRLILVIDEFDYAIALFGQESYYYQMLRSLCSEVGYSTSGILISRRRLTLFEASCKYISTFHGVFPEITVLPFSHEDMEAFYHTLARYGISVSEEGKCCLKDYTGYMPHLCSMFGYEMVRNRETTKEIGPEELYKIHRKYRPQIDRHYEDLKRYLEQDDYMDFAYSLSIGAKCPSIAKREIENMEVMGILIANEEKSEACVFSRDFMNYLQTRPLKLPIWESITGSEKKLKSIFKQVYPLLDQITYQQLCSLDKNRLKDEVKEKYGDLKLKWDTITKYCCSISVYKEQPTVLDSLTLPFVINAILDNWDKNFKKYFGDDSWIGKLKSIRDFRNPVAHAMIDYIEEKERGICLKYCEEIMHLE